MPELKDYWNSIPASANEGIDLDGAFTSVLSRIRRRQRASRLAAVLIMPVLAFALYLALPSEQEPRMLECFAPMGEIRTVNLSDGSLVTLNSGSTLVYSSSYKKGERKVVLSGEATFDVAKNPKQPFVVKTKDFDVLVTGTVFNVSSYSSKSVSSVVLESGSVVIVRGENSSTLVPGQKAELDKDGNLLISNVLPSDYSAWMHGGFIHRQATIYDIIDFIRNTYNIPVSCTFTDKYLRALITCKSDVRLGVGEYLALISELIPGMKYQISDHLITLN